MGINSGKTVPKRILSTVLACLTMAFATPNLPAGTVSALGPWGGPGFAGFQDVMTNNKIEFRNGSNKAISEVDSGDTFYMHVSLSGSNVYQFGGGTTYMIELTDDNLILPQFAGNGLKNGAKYAGFTVSIMGGKRYLTYTVANGQTKEVDPEMCFKNGVTPDDSTVTATLTTMGSFTNKKSTIKANSDVQWTNSKSASPTVIDLGTPVSYTVKASPASDSDTGLWYAGKVRITDTLTMPAGMTFDSAPAITVNGTAAEVTLIDSQTVRFVYEAANPNPKAEMPEQNLKVQLDTSSISGKDGGTFTNEIKTDVWGVGSESSPTPTKTLSPASADVSVSEPTPADITLSKSVQKTEQQYNGFLYDGDYAAFQVTLGNNGDAPAEYAAGALMLTDILPENLTPVANAEIGGMTYTTDGTISGRKVTITNSNPVSVTRQSPYTAWIVCKIADVTNTSAESRRNVVYLGTEDSYEKMATALVTVKAPSMSYSIGKSASTSTFVPGDTVKYTLTISNTCETDINFPDLGAITDDHYSGALGSDQFGAGPMLEAGKSVSFSYDYTTSEEDGNAIVNTFKVGDKTATATVEKNRFSPVLNGMPVTLRMQANSWDTDGSSGYFVIYYTTTLTEEKANQIAAELANFVANGGKDYNLKLSTFDNQFKLSSDKEFLQYDNGTVKGVYELTDDGTLILKPKQEKPAPGLSKTSLDADHAAYVDDEETGFPLFPNWQLVVSNKATGTDDGKMTGITVTDELSDSMEWCPSPLAISDDYPDMVNAYKIVNYNNINSEKSNPSNWIPLAEDNVTSVPGKVTFSFPDVELAPGQAIIVNFATYKPGEESRDKTYYDKATLSCSEQIEPGRVDSGQYVNGKVETTAKCGMGGVETTSFKAIQSFTSEGVEGRDQENSVNYSSSNTSKATPNNNQAGVSGSQTYTEGNLEDHYGQGDWAGDNYVKGKQGKHVQYTLNVQNDATDRDVFDFVVIDRLPFEMTDPGIISGYNRYSAFSVYLNDTSFDIYVDGQLSNDVLDHVDYSTDMTSTLDEFSKDWNGTESGVMNWKPLSGDVDLTTVRDLRFVFKTTGETAPSADNFVLERNGHNVRIVINAIVPDYIANTGEDNIAWNSFAYGYNYFLSEAVTKRNPDGTKERTIILYNGEDGNEVRKSDVPMTAEPAKVGVWVPGVEKPATLNITKKSERFHRRILCRCIHCE